MKKMFFAAFAAFVMVSVSSVFAMNAKYYNTPDGLANDTTADTTVTAPTAEPAPSTGSTAGDGMYIISDTTEVPTTTTDTPADTTTSPSTDAPATGSSAQ